MHPSLNFNIYQIMANIISDVPTPHPILFWNTFQTSHYSTYVFITYVYLEYVFKRGLFSKYYT